MKSDRLYVLCACGLLLAGGRSGAAEPPAMLQHVRDANIAAVVYAQDEVAGELVNAARSRLESILLDNGIPVLDRRRADELSTAAPSLEDPGAFVTAEWFVEHAGRFEIKGLLAMYLSAGATPGLADYYSATAHADIRFISDHDARVQSLSTAPMGAPGLPPSDGLTRSSALINAVQRAVDAAGLAMGLTVMDQARPRAVSLSLEGPVRETVKGTALPTADPRPLARLAVLHDQAWLKEQATAAAIAPAGRLAAVAGYIIDTNFHRHPQRLYGSRVHLIDIEAGRPLNVLDCHTVGMKQPVEQGNRDVLACGFIGSWRYLAAVTGSALFFWDTERGQLMTRIDLPQGLRRAELQLAEEGGATYLIVQDRRHQFAFKIVRGN